MPNEEKLIVSLTEIKSKLESISKKVDTLNELLTGDDDPSKGMVLRLDRLEQTEKRRGWMIKTALGVAIVAIVDALWKLVK